MIFAIINAIKATAKKKPEKIPEFWFFRNYLNCIYNSEDCIITSLLITAGQFLHNNYPGRLQLATGGDDRRIF